MSIITTTNETAVPGEWQAYDYADAQTHPAFMVEIEAELRDGSSGSGMFSQGAGVFTDRVWRDDIVRWRQIKVQLVPMSLGTIETLRDA